jgi:hypothetical protein
LSNHISLLKQTLSFSLAFLSACCLIAAYTAGTTIGFPTVRAYAFAIIDKVSAFLATGTFFFSHPLAPSAIRAVV